VVLRGEVVRFKHPDLDDALGAELQWYFTHRPSICLGDKMGSENRVRHRSIAKLIYPPPSLIGKGPGYIPQLWPKYKGGT
jgi:hypothetical protein